MKSRFETKWPVVEILWDDHVVNGDVEELENLGKLTRIRSCGFLVKEDSDIYCVAQEVHDDNLFRDSTTIDKRTVCSVKYYYKPKTKD